MQIEHYTSPSGATPTLKFLRKLSDKNDAIQILEDITLLEKYSLIQLTKTEDIGKIKGIKQNIWELRTSCRNKIYRSLFETYKDIIHILHIFNKKEQKIRPQEIAIAISRLKYN